MCGHTVTGQGQPLRAALCRSSAAPLLISCLNCVSAWMQHDGLLPQCTASLRSGSPLCLSRKYERGSRRRQQSRAAQILKDPLNSHIGNLSSFKSLCINIWNGTEISPPQRVSLWDKKKSLTRKKKKKDSEQRRPFKFYSLHEFPKATWGKKTLVESLLQIVKIKTNSHNIIGGFCHSKMIVCLPRSTCRQQQIMIIII